MEDISQFMPIISGMLGGAASSGAFKGPIKTLEDLWFIYFGNKASEKAEMIRAKQKISTTEFERKTLEEISKINPQDIQEPKLALIGPALEASRFYIEEKDIRNMFAKLIASSMDKDKSKQVHPSFVEIIKQMTSLDAKNLKSIYDSKGNAPIVEMRLSDDRGRFSKQFLHLYLGNKDEPDYSLIASSLINLSRLGTVNLNYENFYSDNLKYKEFESSRLYEQAKLILEQSRDLSNLDKVIKEHEKFIKQYEEKPGVNISKLKREIEDLKSHKAEGDKVTKIDIIKGVVQITQFGNDFCKACL
ncbi:DUF4393 domain-containing protein [Marinilactibacillus psychrotolerans]|uniref:DUF4393 domain-containing protein n=1 Tax=Marinilactibacillus psychrotolerans TaxID=191770 RepID=A0A5R9BVL7_9LACT|nr:DUF4393 domain-containing protein [Marinilactibacillus psychrotolerans]TLQ04724.1 DUF4393 domain-containing protein [Marinilactibacillus psychrotolerans]